MKKRSILTAIVAGILSIGLIGCGGSNSSNGDDKVIKVGVSPVPHEEIMEVAKPLLEAKGYKVEIVEFTDYVLSKYIIRKWGIRCKLLSTYCILEFI